MTYKTTPSLQDIMNKLAGKKPAPFKQPVYATSDIQAARLVLDRLLAASDRNIVTSITDVPRECDEK